MIIKEETDEEVEEATKTLVSGKTMPQIPSFGGGLGVAEIVITAATPMLEEPDTPFPPVPEEDEDEKPSEEDSERTEKPPEYQDSIDDEVSTSEAVTTVVAMTADLQNDDNDDPTDDCPTDSAPFPISSSTGSEDDPSTGPSTAENSQSHAPPPPQPDPSLPDELDPHQLAKLKSLKESNA